MELRENHIFKSQKAKIFGVIILLIIIVSVPYVANFWDHKISNNTQDWGGFGSYIGGLLSPLLAIGSLYYVVKTFRQQSFENTFNLLLEQHNSLADKISNEVESNQSIIKSALKPLGRSWLESKSSPNAVSINENYEINRYLRFVYQVLKFVDDNCPNDKRKYSRIFRSFLSNDMVYLVGLNGAQHNEEKNFFYNKYKALIEKYGLLEHLSLDYKSLNSIIFEDIKKPDMFIIAQRYELSAFGDCYNISTAINAACDTYRSRLQCFVDETEDLQKRVISLKDFNINLSEKYIGLLEQYANGEANAPSEELLEISNIALEIVNQCAVLERNKKNPQQCVESGRSTVLKCNEAITSQLHSLKNRTFILTKHLEMLSFMNDTPNIYFLLKKEISEHFSNIHDRIEEIRAFSL